MRTDAVKYDRMRRQASPPSPIVKDCLCAFFAGGSICLVGEILRTAFLSAGLAVKDAALLTSVCLIALSALTTALGWYQKLAAHAGAGTLVPITGFANSIVSPAVEFRSEGLVPGVGAKMFIIAGPVIVYGTIASVVWGILYFLSKRYMGG